MSTQSVPTPRLRRAAAAAFVALLSLSAVTSANARGGRVTAAPTIRNPNSWNSTRLAPPVRSFYSPRTSMVAPPMQEVPPIAPLAPRINPGF
jgi:hypothetical protein